MQDMAVNLSDEEFDLIYHTLERANTPYDFDEAGDIVELEYQAWQIVQTVAKREREGPVAPRKVGRRVRLPSAAASPSSSETPSPGTSHPPK
jgi:hypothetical protein